MEEMGTKSMEQLDVPKIRYATPEIAESCERFYQRDTLRREQGRKRFPPMWVRVWMEIDGHTKWKKNEIDKRTGMSWRQLNRIFTKHSLSLSLSLLLNKGLIERIQVRVYKGRGRKPTRYFALCRPFVTHPGYFIRGTPFFGLMATRRRKQEFHMTIRDKNSQDKFPFKNVVKVSVSTTRFVRLFSRERKAIDRLCMEDQSFAAAACKAQLRRRKYLRKSRQVETLEKRA
jgi:hypothetical protein